MQFICNNCVFVCAKGTHNILSVVVVKSFYINATADRTARVIYYSLLHSASVAVSIFATAFIDFVCFLGEFLQI